MKRVIIWIKTTFYFLMSIQCNKKSVILDVENTKNDTLINKKSIIRLGDGEFNLLNGKSIHYQFFSEELKENLNEIVLDYLDESKNVNYILCMPGEYFRPSGIKLAKRRVYISSWAFSRYLFKKKYDQEVIYGDSFIFAKGNDEIFERLWIESKVKNVIFVHNNKKYADEFEKKYSLNTESIIIPSSNAYEEKENILQRIIKASNGKSELVVLISAGPCAKYLVQQLSTQNIWALDTGHCWDDPLNLFEH